MAMATQAHRGGRPSSADLSSRLERSRLRAVVLQDEVTALTAELGIAGDEIEALSRRMEMAIMAGRDDVALHVAGRLEALAHSLQRRSAA